MTLRFVRSSTFHDIPLEHWRSVGEDLGFEYTTAWLSSFERLHPEYLTLWDGDVLAAVAPVYFGASRQPAFSQIHDPYSYFFASGDAKEAAPKEVAAEHFQPWLLVGPPGTHNAPLIRGDYPPAKRAATLRALLEAVRGHALERGVKMVFFPCLETKGLIELCDAIDAAIPTLHYPDEYLVVPATFEDYLEKFRRRSFVRREIRAFERAGYEIHRMSWAEARDDFLRLHPAHVQKYSDSSPETALEARPAQYSAMPAENVSAFSAIKNGCVRSVMIGYELDRRLYLRTYVADEPEIERKSYVYQNLAFYGALRYAIGKGLRRIHYSSGSDEAKLIRGTHMLPLSMVLWPLAAGPWDMVRSFLEVQSSHRIRYGAALIQRFGSEPDQAEQDLGEIAALFS